MLVARPDVAMPLLRWLTEVLNSYGAVEYVGVGNR